MKQRKLFIDDLREAPDNTWVEARKVEAAIRLISMFKFDVISLDHDIENRPDDETFKPVAYYLAEKYRGTERDDFHSDHPRVIIHSVNPVGAQEMAKVLDEAGITAEITPFESDAAFKSKYGLNA